MEKIEEWEGPLPQGESNEDYHARPELSSTQIKRAAETGLHFRHFVVDKNFESSRALEFGNLAHDFVFAGNWGDYVRMPEFRPIKASPGVKAVTMKAQVEAFQHKYRGERIISAKDHDTLCAMKDAFDNDPLVQSLIHKDDLIEQGFIYRDEDTGQKCKFRPDRLSTVNSCIIDYKTTVSASPEKFKWSIVKYGYHISAAHYMLGADRVFPGLIKKFIFIAQEKTAPYACGAYLLSGIDLTFGRESRRVLMNKIKKWETSGEYPSYTTKLRPIELPNYETLSEEKYSDEEFAEIDF